MYNRQSLTLQVFAFVLILSIPLGIVVAFLLQLRSKILHGLLTIYIWIMRGTPLLLQLIFIYYVLPSIGIRIDRLPAAITAFTLNYAAYFAEIFRGGILAIPTGQYLSLIHIWGRYGFDRHYEVYFATHLADVKRQLNITAKNNNSYALAA